MSSCSPFVNCLSLFSARRGLSLRPFSRSIVQKDSKVPGEHHTDHLVQAHTNYGLDQLSQARGSMPDISNSPSGLSALSSSSHGTDIRLGGKTSGFLQFLRSVWLAIMPADRTPSQLLLPCGLSMRTVQQQRLRHLLSTGAQQLPNYITYHMRYQPEQRHFTSGQPAT